jgi:hypothetical protein
MAGVESRNFDSPDETRTPDKTRVDLVRMGATTASYPPAAALRAAPNTSASSARLTRRSSAA